MRSNGGATLYTKVWKKGGGPNPAFLLLIHENTASRTSVNDIPNIVFFPNPASVPKFWRIALPQRQSNPVSRQYFPNAALCFGQIRFFLIFAPSPQSERLEPRLADVNITFAEFGIFFKNSWFHWCEVFTDLQLIFTDMTLHSFFELLLQAILTPGQKLLFRIQLSFWCNPNFFRSRLLTSPDFLHHSESISKSIDFRAIFQDIIYKASSTWKITFPHFSMILPKKMILPSLFQSFSLFFFLVNFSPALYYLTTTILTGKILPGFSLTL